MSAHVLWTQVRVVAVDERPLLLFQDSVSGELDPGERYVAARPVADNGHTDGCDIPIQGDLLFQGHTSRHFPYCMH
ncbi:hypothetical protein H257_08337 [Aphanomyces astaci]|uniref:Uncharacterized protein n=1 Tax=Aphanomyces astaci TaxID=112090 RepID=W4GGG5_APHAT|nr:hypothetical protein H257_08337 [Aphanomyces astaci]ETV78134.1 hypothetical protein H257_08337 [Aphanomyces astaci]|eukprot:XP_009832471.1 hypothetical protein H257_08337 [Aphanomyces astaci]